MSLSRNLHSKVLIIIFIATISVFSALPASGKVQPEPVSSTESGGPLTFLPAVFAPYDGYHYISPTGDDGNTGRSPADPWATFDRAWTDLQPGDTLFLLDGIYYQSIEPDVRDGLPGSPITVRALNDGQAIIDGQNARVPVKLGPWVGWNRDYYVIEGIVARNSIDSVYEINGNHNILRRVSGYNANNDTNSHVFTLTGKYTLLEDCIASGTGRKMAFTWGGQYNTIRGCFTNWQQFDARDFDGEWPWGEDLELYNSSDSIIENSISYGTAPKTAVSVLGNINSANGDAPYSRNNQILGVMSIRNGAFEDGSIQEWPTTRPQPTDAEVISKYKEWAGWRLGFGVILWGANAEVSNTQFQDIFAWGNAGLGFDEVHPSALSTNMSINRATIVGNGLDAPWSDGGIGSNVQMDRLSHYSIANSRIGGTSYQGEGARLQHRYVEGVLMDGSNGQNAQSLWPWPMQDRILTELGIDVTGEITAILQDNGVATGASLPAPTISPPPIAGNVISGDGVPAYLGPIQVDMSTSVSGATIRYTTDGTDPTSGSTPYSGPFMVNSSTVVKAKVFQNGNASHARSVYIRIDNGRPNNPPVVNAALLPFVYPTAEIMWPTNEIALYGSATDATLPNAAHGLTTNWSVAAGPGGATFADPNAPRTTVTFAQPGNYTLRLTADDGVTQAHADVAVNVLPDGGYTTTLPGRIEAENFRGGGEGVGYHDFTWGNFGGVYREESVDLMIAYNEWTGYSVTDMEPGEWIAYNTSVAQTGEYDLTIRLTGAIAGGVFHVELDGANISGPITVPYTSDGLRAYASIVRRTPVLSAGAHTLRIVIDQSAPGQNKLFAAINFLQFDLAN